MDRRTLFAVLVLAASAVSAAVTEPPPLSVPAAPGADTPPAAPAPAVPGPAPGIQRGMLLYENHCQHCHDCRLHLRGDRRRAADLAAVRRDVQRWAAELKVTWGTEEIDDVVTYLNRTYYKYPPAR